MDNAYAARLTALYSQGLSYGKIADDAELQATLLPEVTKRNTRIWKIYKLVQELVQAGTLPDRITGNVNGKSVVLQPVPGDLSAEWKIEWPTGTVSDPPTASLTVTPPKGRQAELLASYEQLIGSGGAPARRRRKLGAPTRRTETVILADLHIEDELTDEIVGLCQEHAGRALILAGDINDFEAYGRFLSRRHSFPTLKEVLARTDALFELFSRAFTSVTVILGNHDDRLLKHAAKAGGPDYYWLTQQFLHQAYEQRHGVQIARNTLTKQSGRQVELYHYVQQGDAIISHCETHGKVQGRGVEGAHNFFYGWQQAKALGIQPFSTVIHAHTHKRSYFQHPMTGIHCYELGCMCDFPDYAVGPDAKYMPPQNGYFFLVQEDGKTLINESRAVALSGKGVLR